MNIDLQVGLAPLEGVNLVGGVGIWRIVLVETKSEGKWYYVTWKSWVEKLFMC